MKKKPGNSLQKFIAVGIFILLAILVFNLFNTFGLKGGIETKLAEMRELSRPAKLELITIRTDCSDCFSIDEVLTSLKSSDINVTNELTLDSSSQEAASLIDQHGIEKLPTIILTGEINKTSLQNFKQEGDILIFKDTKPPYIDAKTGEIIGKVSVIRILDKNCEVCDDFGRVIQGLQQSGVVFSETRQIDFNSSEAGELITRYGMKRVPSLLLSADIDAYPVAQSLKQAGLQTEEGYYLIEGPAPYVEVNTSRTRGLVNLTMLNDSSCRECYDVAVHKQVLTGFGLAIQEEKTLDVASSEGKELAESYNITKVPTIILTGDVAVYGNLNRVWQQVGTVEADGAYVFRNLDALGRVVYKDLSTNEIVR